MSGDDERPDTSSFADAVGPVRRIPRSPRVETRPSATATPGRVAADPTTTPFVYPAQGEPRLAYSQGIDQRQFDRLRSGRIPVEVEIDLHGLSESNARTALRDSLGRAHQAHTRCVRVVHGRGLHSTAGPVLKNALPGWLTEAPLGHRVLAFAPATPGGAGAVLVLLRRQGRH